MLLTLAIATTILLFVLIVLLIVALVVRRSLDAQREARERETYERLRPHVVAWLGDPDAEPGPELVGATDARSRDVLSKLLSRYGSMLRGEARDRLIRFVAEQGYVEASVRDLRSLRPWRRGRAARALGDFGSARAVRHLSLLVVRDRDRFVRLAATRALGRIDDYKSAAALLMLLPTEQVPAGVVAQSLLDLGIHGFGALVSGCDDEDDVTRRTACRLVGLIGAGASPDAMRAAHDVLRRRAATDDDAGVRTAALGALAALGDTRSEEVVRAALHDEEPAVRQAAAATAHALFLREVAPDLIEVVGRELQLDRPNWRLVRTASHAWAALAEQLDPDALPVEAREVGMPFLREAAVASSRSLA
ncbi:MAG: lyase domain protein repeat-containing protein [Thermoleophilia bacterium]|nr:lyase domain protein repeat-containing protein [Thermoleophilia bacterium]